MKLGGITVVIKSKVIDKVFQFLLLVFLMNMVHFFLRTFRS